LFNAAPKSFAIGNCVQPVRNLSRYVKWPKYVRLQRQRSILYDRLKTPPSIAQFTRTLDKASAAELFKMLDKYKPETKQDKAKRLKSVADTVAAGKKADAGKKPLVLKFGINHITDLVENRTAKLVIIAHDVDPIELVVWLPALCRKCDVPYCIVKSKARLGKLVNQKTVTAVAVTAVEKADEGKFGKMIDTIKTNFLERFDEERRHWGGGLLGLKSQAATTKARKAVEAEEKKRFGL